MLENRDLYLKEIIENSHGAVRHYIDLLEQQVKTLKHDGEVLNKHAMKLEEQLEEQLEEYKKRLCE